MQLNCATSKPCPLEHIAIATNREVESQHCGLVYPSSSGTSKLCDLKWENNLWDRDVPPDYLWVRVSLEEYEVSAVAEFVEYVIRSHKVPKTIKYSFMYAEGAFDNSGRLCDGSGLTCATFVVGIFDQLKLHIVHLDSWRERPRQDSMFRRRIVDTARKYRQFAMATRLEEERPNFRLKPWELVSAATHRRYPVRFRQTLKLTKTMSKLVRRLARP